MGFHRALYDISHFPLPARTLSFSASYYWLGANDRSAEGGYAWANKAPLAFLNWAPGELYYVLKYSDLLHWNVLLLSSDNKKANK